ncbi:MAG: ATP-binding protein [Verrucomicrobia bacterium]|nr:ATP-binding protein [Verrucomicrobiota bacterium]
MPARPAMPGGFVGRAAELAALERHYRAASSGLIPVYGRRRVGKTELILRFCAKKPTVCFTASDKLRTPQIADFMAVAAEWLAQPHLAAAAPQTWEAALRLVLGAAPAGRKLVLVLDEFQWLCASSPELPSVLQRLWDHEWQRGKRLLLILCGSFIGFMEREVLGARSPLHGRRTAALRLEPFGFREAARFHPRWSREEQARACFICGGIPAYLRRFDPHRSVAQNIATEFFAVDAFFQREPDFLLREKLAEVKQAASVLEATARGRHSQGEIARSIGLSTAALAPHLKSLVAPGYLERVFPLMPGRPPRTSVLYRVADPLLRFWFRFIEPHWSTLRRFGPERAFEQLVAPQWDAYCGDSFERLCREALPLLYAAEGVAGKFAVGEYWDRAAQIDVVGLRADGWIDLGECKWHGRSAPATVARELAARVAHYPGKGRTVRPVAFLRSQPRMAPPDLAIYALPQLYGDDANG